MKKTALITLCLLFISSLTFAQRQKTDTFNGTLTGIPGMQATVSITCTVDNTTGNCTFTSKGNGLNVDPFTWKGQIPAAKVQDLKQANAVWGGQLTMCSDMTCDNGGKKGVMTSKVSNTAKGTIAGMTAADGKSVNLTIRIPYVLPGKQQANIPFTCTFILNNDQDDDGFGDGFGSLDDMSDEEYDAYVTRLWGPNWRTEHPEFIRNK